MVSCDQADVLFVNKCPTMRFRRQLLGGMTGGICIQNPMEQGRELTRIAGRRERVGLAEWREREQDLGIEHGIWHV
jgi:hypothetical protein